MKVAREVKVGAFVLAGLIATGLVVFLIGDERRLFERHLSFHAIFDDVQGLKPGSPVRMGGFDIGRVGEIGYSTEMADQHLHVVLEVAQSDSVRIREDSVATVGNRGLLGDKMVVITVGSVSAPPLAPGSQVKTEPARDLSEMLDKLSSLGERADQIMKNLESTTGMLAEEGFREDVQSGVHSLSSILRQLDEGDGYIGLLLRDPEEAARLSRTMENVERVSSEAHATVAGINRAVRQVNQGPGFAHEVIYGDEGARAVSQVGGAADEVAATLRGIREGNGLARSVIYGDDASASLMADLQATSQDVRAIVSEVRQGKGTVGALLRDPSVYEDLKLLLGNVERNRTLRALVRHSIQTDEKAPKARVRDSASGQGSPAPPGGSPAAGVE